MNKCGTYEMNITPPLGTHIPGHFSKRFSTGIKDDLYAKAMVIEDKRSVIALLSIDVLSIDHKIVERIRERIADQISIPTDQIMISATHTHTGGPRMPREYEVPLDKETGDLFKHIVKKAADAVIIAFENRKKVLIGAGSGKESDIAFNRRYFMKDGNVKTNPGIKNPDIVEAEGPIDPEVLVVRIDDLNGKPIGVIVNYACHTDVVGGTEYSADYPGEMSRVLKQVLGENVVCLFGLGACGNINHIDVHQASHTTHQEHYKKMGRILAGKVLTIREKIGPLEHMNISAKQHIISVPSRLPTTEDIEEARRILKAGYGLVGPAQRTMGFVNNSKIKEASDVEVQVLEMGEIAIVGIPCELFVEYGLEMKKNSSASYTIINTLTNGSYQYVPTEEAIARGGYESTVSSNRLAANAGKRMVETALELIKNES